MLLCPCMPCCSESDKRSRTVSLIVRDRTFQVRASPNHRHGILWRIEKILIRQCETKDDKRKLLNFAERILAGSESAISKPGDSAFLQAILTALPSGEESEEDCRNLMKALEADGVNMSMIFDLTKDTPLLRAIKTGNRGALDALLHTHCDINATDRYSTTCLIYAVQRNDKETVQTILRRFPKSVNLDKTDYANYTALAYAASNNNIQLCTLLLDAGARPDVNSSSPLFLAVSNNSSYNLIQLLVSRGGSVNVSNSDGLSALAAATKNQEPDIVSLLLEHGANFSTAWYKNPAFNIALNTDHLEILKIFLDNGVDIFCTNQKGSSIVHEACSQGSIQLLSYVVSSTNINLDLRNRQRRTAAHLAAQYGHRSCLETLFHAGADCWSLDPRGQSALELALFNNRSNCALFFVEQPVYPRQLLFSVLHMLQNDYDPDALSRKPAVALFTDCLNNKWGDDQVDTLFNTCVIVTRRILRQKPAARVAQLPLPLKVRDRLLSTNEHDGL